MFAKKKLSKRSWGIPSILLKVLPLLLLSSCKSDNPCLACAAMQIANLKHVLAEYYAPVIYHDTSDDCYQCDYMTKINFDSDYNTRNNWDHTTGNYDKDAYVYYSISSTPTHHYIGYFFYHPRDSDFPTHHNDLEGVILMVDKDGGEMGTIVAMETMAHNELYQYAYCPDRNGNNEIDRPDEDDNPGENDATVKKASNGEDIDGCLKVYSSNSGNICNAEDGAGCISSKRKALSLPNQEHNAGVHPLVFIQAEGHGVAACAYEVTATPLGGDINCNSAPGGDGIIYYYGGVAEEPTSGSGNFTRHVSYSLIPMDAGKLSPGDSDEDQGLWYLQDPENFSAPTSSYKWWGILRSGDGDHKAKSPWAWDDDDDNQVYVGDIFCDPAFSFDTHLNGSEFDDFTHIYSDHVYYTHHVVLKDVHIKKHDCDSWDPTSKSERCDVFMVMAASFESDSELGGKYIGEDNWKKDNMVPGNRSEGTGWISWFHGGYDATGPVKYSTSYDDRYICRPPGTNFRIRPWDSDEFSDDPIDNLYRLNDPELPVESLGDMGTNLGRVSIRFAIYGNSDYFDPAPYWQGEIPECVTCESQE